MMEEGRPRAGQSSRPPTKGARPTWVLVLSSLMFFWAVSGLDANLDRIKSIADPPKVMGEAPLHLPEEDLLVRQHQRAVQTLENAHARTYNVLAIADVLASAVMLFAVAAIAANDGRARKAAIIAAWTAIAYLIVDASCFFLILRRTFEETVVPLRTELYLRQYRDLAAETVASLRATAVPAALVAQIAKAVLVIGFFTLVLRYFGGPAGRAYYGADGARPGGSR